MARVLNSHFLDKQEIIKLAKKAGTYEISILPHFDCCSFLMPDRPATKSTSQELGNADRELAGAFERRLGLLLALGLADAASTFTSLALQAVFYRLFFAEWYIVLQVGVTGFLYTALGVYLGRSLGMNLRKVHQ